MLMNINNIIRWFWDGHWGDWQDKSVEGTGKTWDRPH